MIVDIGATANVYTAPLSSYVMQFVILEPQTAFDARQVCPTADFGEYTDADPHIFSLLRGGSMPLMTLLNQVTRSMPARSKRQRMAIKRQILLRLCRLIRVGQLGRIKRKFVDLPYRQSESVFGCAARRGSTVMPALP